MTNRELLHQALDQLEGWQYNALCSLLFGCAELEAPILAPCECCEKKEVDSCEACDCAAVYRAWLDREAVLREKEP